MTKQKKSTKSATRKQDDATQVVERVLKRHENRVAKAEKQPKKALQAKLKAELQQAAKKPVSTSAVDADDVLAAIGGTAPKAGGIRGAYLRWLAANSTAYSAAYVNSLRRPVGDFIDYCEANGVTSVMHIKTSTLEAYRKHVQAQGNAISTTRMALARVSTFLRAQESCNGDLSVLRVQHTPSEKKAMAAKAEVAA